MDAWIVACKDFRRSLRPLRGMKEEHRLPAAQKDRFRGVRIFDISDIKNPRQVAAVQTCRGSHTHTLVVDPKDKDNVYSTFRARLLCVSRKSWPGARASSGQGPEYGTVPH